MDERPEAFAERSPKRALTGPEICLFVGGGLFLIAIAVIGTWTASQMGGPGVLPG